MPLVQLDTLEVTVASLDPAAPHGVRDCDGRITAWLSEHNAHAVLVRPDFYVFGGAVSPQAVPELLEDLRTQLNITLTLAIPGALR
jgi:flavoprotein hydroxylase